MTARGGRGLAVATDCTDEAQVAAAFAQVERDHGGLDVLANAVWGGHDAFRSADEWMASMGRPFWERAGQMWSLTMDAGPRAYLLASAQAARLMTPRKRGLIVGLTDFVFGDPEVPKTGHMPGMLFPVVAHDCINRLMYCLSEEVKKAGIAVVTLMPGFMRTERVERAMTTDKLKKMMRYDLSESVLYLGRAVAALAGDPKVTGKTGRIHYVADLAEEYGFTDVDGTRHPRFHPFTTLIPAVLVSRRRSPGRLPQVGGAGSVFSRLGGAASSSRSASCTARSSCGSRPAITSFGQFSTSMSGATPSFSTAHLPSRVKKPPRGAIIVPPSMNGGVSAVCTRPPQVRVPTSGPILRRRNMYGIRSPPEPAISLMIITFGPQMPADGLVNGTRSPATLLK